MSERDFRNVVFCKKCVHTMSLSNGSLSNTGNSCEFENLPVPLAFRSFATRMEQKWERAPVLIAVKFDHCEKSTNVLVR
jgi:hypothetical protein